jgi:HlyD family secretion protein
MKANKNKRRKRNVIINWIFFTVLIAGVGAISYYSYRQTQEKTRWTLQEYQSAESVYRGDLQITVLASAVLQPYDVVQVRPEASGRVEELLVDIGDIVYEGQPLAVLDQEDLQTRLETARAELSRAGANLQLVQRGYVPRERQSLQAAVDQAQLGLQEATEDLNHTMELHDAGFASDEELDTAEYAVEQAQQAKDQAVDALNVLLDGSTPEEIQSARAAYEIAALSVREAENALGDATIYSPMSGVILDRFISVGSVVVSSLATFGQGDALFSIGDLSRMKAFASVDENDIGSVELGQECTLNVDSYPDVEFEGTVLKMHPQADTQAGVTTFTAEIEVPNEDGRLMSGMSCEVEIIAKTYEDLLLVSDRAVTEHEDKFYVFVVGENDRIEVREIETGETNYEETEVKSGLEEGEMVIVRSLPIDLIEEAVGKHKGEVTVSLG